MRRNSGFTAFELAVTIAIISVITAITMPPYLTWWRENRMRSSVSNLAADLEMAKTRAIRENASVVIDFNAGNYIVFLDNDDSWSQNNGEPVLVNRILPAGVSIDTASLNFSPETDKVRFNSRGIPLEVVSPKTVTINQAAYNRQITINRLGNIDVQ